MKLCLVLLGIAHFFGLAVLFAITSMSDVVGLQIVSSGGLSSSYATFPLSFLVGATAVVISPAGVIMNKYGYKKVFLLGTLLGVIGSLICVGALFASPTLALVLYTIGLVPQGFAYGIVQYYRHVAALMGADESTKSWYIAIVISSGALGGIAGPALSAVSQYWYPGRPFVATCICIAAVEALHFITLIFTSINIDKPLMNRTKSDEPAQKPRSLFKIVTQPTYFCAFITGTTAQGLMILMMGVTPLVMKQQITEIFWDLAFVIEGHVLCMYLPSFFTSKVIARFSAIYVAQFGVILTGIGASIYLFDDGHKWHQYAAIATSMAVVGLGWNFSFVCATTLLTGTYTPEEKFKAQAFNDTCLFGLAAILTLISGVLLKTVTLKFVIIGCVITYIIVAIFNAGYIIWTNSQKKKNVVHPESDHLEACVKENPVMYDAIQSTVTDEGANKFLKLNNNIQPNRQRLYSTSLADVHFHSKDAEKKFLEHLLHKLSANCVCTTEGENIDTVLCTDKNVENLYREAATKLLSDTRPAAMQKPSEVTVHKISVNSIEYTIVSLTLPQLNSLIFFIYDAGKREEVDNGLEWMKTNGKFVESLFNVLEKLTTSAPEDDEGWKHSDIECATSSQKQVIEDLTKLFEKELLKRRVKQKADDFWDEYGRNEFQKRLWYYVENNDPVLFVLPAFPFKSSNLSTKVLGILPDMGEKLALQKLEKFLYSIESIYLPGAFLVMFSDGRVYCDQFRISDEITSKFKVQIRRTYPSEVIYWSDLDMFFPKFNDDEKREALVNLFGTSPENIEVEIKNDSDFREVYCGFKKFMKEELYVPKELGNRKGRQVITGVAKNLMMRNYSYGHFMKILFPNHVRLSIHPSQCTTKFSINMVGETDWGTPWHNCALLQPDGTWSLIRRKTAEDRNYKLTTSEDGLPYYINDTDEIFKENL